MYIHYFWHCQRQVTPCKTQSVNNLHFTRFFQDNILPYDSDIGYTIVDILRNVIITQVEDFQWKI